MLKIGVLCFVIGAGVSVVIIHLGIYSVKIISTEIYMLDNSGAGGVRS